MMPVRKISPGAIASFAMAITAISPALLSAQGANSPEVQRLAAQKNRAILQQYQARQSAAQRAAAARANAGAVTAPRGIAPGVASAAARGAYATSAAGTAGVRSTASASSMRGISTALAAFSNDVGRMPTQAEGLGVLLNAPPGVRGWRGPYISQVNWHQALTDPWGNRYRYIVRGAGRSASYTISSDGPDRIQGTQDDLMIQF